MILGIERRLQPRVEIRWPVTVLTTQTTIEGEIHNLSPSGAFLSCKGILALEGSFFIIIKPPERQTISVAGKVVWSTALQTEESNSSLGMGVQFTNITPGDRTYLSQFVKTHKNKENR
ncbi:MAG: PilZ domain-containing protein [Deltaproteobacteria bacterium]|jgi:Tfp pilus assembly protein PilZ